MDPDAVTFVLSPFFEVLISTLMTVGERASAHPSFQAAAYEAISSLVTNCPADCMPIVQNLTTAVLQTLERTVAMQGQLVGTDEKRAHIEFQANLCGVLTVCLSFSIVV
jgi:importin subunit beta-1